MKIYQTVTEFWDVEKREIYQWAITWNLKNEE